MTAGELANTISMLQLIPEIRNAVRETFEMLAPEGGFMFNGGVKSLDFSNPDVQKINAVIIDEAEKLSTQYYG